MATNLLSPPTADLLDAGYVRLSEFGTRALALEAEYQPTDEIDAATFDLWMGLEKLALTSEVGQQNVIKAYLQETYGLLAVGLDPLLHSLLPPVPATGATVRPLVLGIQGGKVLGLQGGKVLGLDYRLVANLGPPVFNTRLLPGQTVGAVTFTGANGDYFEFNMPMNAATGGPQQMFLFVGGVQVAGIDFPADAVGDYFRLNYNGVNYLGNFQIVPTTSRVDLQPE